MGCLFLPLWAVDRLARYGYRHEQQRERESKHLLGQMFGSVWERGVLIKTPYGCFQNRGTPKWMVYKGNTLRKWMIWGGKHPYFWQHPYWEITLQGTITYALSQRLHPPFESMNFRIFRLVGYVFSFPGGYQLVSKMSRFEWLGLSPFPVIVEMNVYRDSLLKM